MTSRFHPGPLFHARVHPEPITSFAFPPDLERRHAVLLGAVAAVGRGRLHDDGSLHGDFLSRVFGDTLGYRPADQRGAEGWELAVEQRTAGTSVEGALGFFRAGEPDRILVPIVVISARRGLDRSGGPAPTPVQRGWDFASRSPGCRFILVSNGQETRLYSTAHTPDVCETFWLEDLATSDGFKRFYYLLARHRLLGPAPGVASPVERLLVSSARAQKEVTGALYTEYRGLRRKLFAQLRRSHPGEPALDVLGHAQRIMDRVLFVAFAQGRGLLPRNTLSHAITPRREPPAEPLWPGLRAVFHGLDRGQPDQRLPAYGGGLFRSTPALDRLLVSDELCRDLAGLERHDFRNDISIEVLGHVFEQSMSDLEALRRGAAGLEPGADQPSKRHDEGVFYTPVFVTRYLVDRTLGRTLTALRASIFDRIKPEERKGRERIAASIEAWEAYREELSRLRVLDPSCGSGAFLMAAYDALGREHERVDGELAELRGGQLDLFDLDEAVTDDHLFGVDINPESVELTRLSLWLKTAQHGRRLTYLDGNIQWGDSIVSDPDLSPAAFDWARGSMARGGPDTPTDPERPPRDARWREGFDVVIGNPPYVRHELFTRLKDHLDASYVAYSGMADIYVYFLERGLSVLKPGGRLGFIVSNKWLRAGYAAPLRRLLAADTEIEALVDFGHAPIFEDADTFPCIIVLRKLVEGGEVPVDHQLSVTAFPRAELEKVEVAEYVATHQYPVPQRRLGEEAWSLEPPALDALLAKVRANGINLAELTGAKPYYGIKTGLNEAFLVDGETRDRLCAEDPRSAEILRRYVRGQDLARWSPAWRGLWMIFARRGIDIDAYPAIKRHLEGHRAALEPRPADRAGGDWGGRKAGSYRWFELQDSIDYWELFDAPKLFCPDIAWRSQFCLDTSGLVTNNTVYLLPSQDPWLLTVLNSPLLWAYCWRKAVHAKDEALRFFGEFVEQLPIAEPGAESRRAAEEDVPQLIALMKEDHAARLEVLAALTTQMKVEAPGAKLQAFEALSRDAFVAEVAKRRPKALGKLKPADIKYLREVHDEATAPLLGRRARALAMERRLADLVNRAYGLDPVEVELLWTTAPPRMPVGR